MPLPNAEELRMQILQKEMEKVDLAEKARAAKEKELANFTTGFLSQHVSEDEIAMVRTIERVIGQPIPRISVPGYDFGTVAAD